MKTFLERLPQPLFEGEAEGGGGGGAGGEGEGTSPTAPAEGAGAEGGEGDDDAGEVKPGEKPDDTDADDADETPPSFDTKEIEIPEGMFIPEGTMDKFGEILNNAELTPQERGEQLFALQSEVAEQAAQKLSEDFVNTQNSWRAELKNDADYGPKLDESLGVVETFLDQEGIKVEGFDEAMKFTGAGNHPAITKTFINIARKFSEGSAITGDSARGGVEQEDADVLFGSTD